MQAVHLQQQQHLQHVQHVQHRQQQHPCICCWRCRQLVRLQKLLQHVLPAGPSWFQNNELINCWKKERKSDGETLRRGKMICASKVSNNSKCHSKCKSKWKLIFLHFSPPTADMFMLLGSSQVGSLHLVSNKLRLFFFWTYQLQNDVRCLRQTEPLMCKKIYELRHHAET